MWLFPAVEPCTNLLVLPQEYSLVPRLSTANSGKPGNEASRSRYATDINLLKQRIAVQKPHKHKVTASVIACS